MCNTTQKASINLNDIDDEFLLNLTRSNATMIKYDNPEYDDVKCWLMGEKTTGVWIAHRYYEQCDSGKECNPAELKNFFMKYLKKINIVDLKTQTAYFNWLSLGGKHNEPYTVMQMNYLKGCECLISFCKHVVNKNCDKHPNEPCDCFQFDKEILTLVDRRHFNQRRCKERRIKQIKLKSLNITDRRKTNRRNAITNRRMKDPRGINANYL